MVVADWMRRAGDPLATRCANLWSLAEDVVAVVFECFGVWAEAVRQVQALTLDRGEVDFLEFRDVGGFEKA